MTSAAAAAFACLAPRARAAAGGPPAARIEPVVETVHGVRIADPYRWMETPSDPDWPRFIEGQGAYARHVLDSLPGRVRLLVDITAASGEAPRTSDFQQGGGMLFRRMRPAGAQADVITVGVGPEGTQQVLVDPKRFETGQRLSIDYWRVSPDGRRLLFGISGSGSEDSVLRVLDVASGRLLTEAIDRTTYASPAWLPDGSGFIYNRLAAGKPKGTAEAYQGSGAWLHRVGTPDTADVPMFTPGQFPDIALDPDESPVAFMDPSSPVAVLAIYEGVKPELRLYTSPLAAVTAGAPVWRKVCDRDDGVVVVWPWRDSLYLLSHRDAPRYRVLRVDARAPDMAKAEVVFPMGEMVLQDIHAARDALYVVALDAGVQRLFRIPPGGRPQPVDLPVQGVIGDLCANGSEDGAWVMAESWTRPPVLCRVDARGAVKSWPLTAYDTTRFESREVLVPARDGAQVPLSIIYRKGQALDGSAPLILTAYGAYGGTLDPLFNPSQLAFLDYGGVLATAHVRGGGEKGEAWHQAGRKETKPNTWRDMIDCAEWLVAQGWTRHERLALQGKSAGGITVGRALTERPDLACAVISRVGVSNMTRVETTSQGPANVPEFGTVAKPDEFRCLLEMDAYQHVRDGTPYPAVLLTVALHDARVPAWQPGKMAARLQAATSSGKPVLLRVEGDAGHGMGSTRAQLDAELADIYSFALWRAGDPGFQPRPS